MKDALAVGRREFDRLMELMSAAVRSEKILTKRILVSIWGTTSGDSCEWLRGLCLLQNELHLTYPVW